MNDVLIFAELCSSTCATKQNVCIYRWACWSIFSVSWFHCGSLLCIDSYSCPVSLHWRKNSLRLMLPPVQGSTKKGERQGRKVEREREKERRTEAQREGSVKKLFFLQTFQIVSFFISFHFPFFIFWLSVCCILVSLSLCIVSLLMPLVFQ